MAKMKKTKTLYGHSVDQRIGTVVAEPDAPQAVKLVPDNKTMIALPFNDNHDEEVEPQRLASLQQIFDFYKPSKEVPLKDAEGDTDDKVLKFKNLKDFTKDGIVAQSDILQDLEAQESTYSRFLDVLQNNAKLRNILANETDKKAFITLIETLIEELSANE